MASRDAVRERRTSKLAGPAPAVLRSPSGAHGGAARGQGSPLPAQLDGRARRHDPHAHERRPMKRVLLIALIALVILVLATGRWAFDAVRALTRKGTAGVMVLLAILALLVLAASAAAGPTASLRPLAKTPLPLGDVVWDGGRLFYVAEHTGRIDRGEPGGGPLRPYAKLPHPGEEVRCVPAPSAQGFAAGLYCHTAANDIYRVTSAGRIIQFASLPERRTSDGALAFDTGGRFGFALLAATGRSDDRHGGAVFAISRRGTVRRIGSYSGPGGAENAAIAPPGFGSAAGDLLLTTDAARIEGRLLAVDPRGRVSTIAVVHGDGLNSLAVLPATAWRGHHSGVAIADTRSRIAWLVRAAILRPYLGDVLATTELRGGIYVVEPTPRGYRTVRLNLVSTLAHYNLEGATVVP
jgi:hypothetical protein